MTKLTIVILNYNTKDLTIRAVTSCLNLSYKDLQVWVVDNASDDGSVQALRTLARKEKRLILTTLSQNIGFAGGNNVALREITSEYVMLLNSDAYFTTGSDLETVIDFLDQHPDIGILTPYVKLPSNVLDPASHRGFPTPWNAITYFSGLEKITNNIPFLANLFGGYHQTWKNLKTIHQIDACTGAAMIIRREAMEEVGLLDEQFFMYGEDLDWCYRFKSVEWDIVFFPELTVIHDKHSSGIKKKNKKTHHAFYDAMRLFYQKHDLGPPWMENLVLFGIRTIAKLRS